MCFIVYFATFKQMLHIRIHLDLIRRQKKVDTVCKIASNRGFVVTNPNRCN